MHQGIDPPDQFLIFLTIELDEAGLGDGDRNRMEAFERDDLGHEARALCLEHLPDRLVAALRMLVRLGVGDALVEQPDVQILQAPDPKPWGEEPFADKANLVFRV